MGLLDHVKIENLDEDQRKMVELVGLDGFKSLVRAFGGTTIYIPKAESLDGFGAAVPPCRSSSLLITAMASW